jgi:predicted RNA-binding protein with PIN domain
VKPGTEGRRPRRWLIDGMNVIGSRPDRWWNDPDGAVRRLAEKLAEFADATGDEVTVVFDRRPRDMEAGRHGGATVAFATRRGRNAADQDIIEMANSDDDPGSLTVVTSDRPLAERVRELGARVMPAGSFRDRFDPSRSPRRSS